MECVKQESELTQKSEKCISEFDRQHRHNIHKLRRLVKTRLDLHKITDEEGPAMDEKASLEKVKS